MNISDVKKIIPEVQNIAISLFSEINFANSTADGATAASSEGSTAIAQLTSGLNRELADVATKVSENSAVAETVAAITVAHESVLANLIAASIAAKRAGVYPYYLATATALVLLDSAETPCGESSNSPVNTCNLTDIDLTSIIDESLFTHFQLKFEPELKHLIRKQIAAMKANGLTLQKPEHYEKIKKAYELGFLYEGVYRGCAQCVLAALFELTGNASPEVFRTASAMGGGGASCGDGSCGAYNGSLMGMGMFVGRRFEHITGDQAEKDKAVAMSQVLHDNFIDTYGSVICKNIHESIFGRSYTLRYPAEREAFTAAGAYTEKCTAVVGMASAWAMEQLILNGYA